MNLGDPPGASSALFERQKAAAAREPAPDAASRRAALATLESLLRGNADALAKAISADFGGRSLHETQLLEIFPAIEGIRHARRHVGAWMRPQRRATNFWFLPGRSHVMFQPLGVVGIVVPWNYPVYLAVGPMVAAMAAGNRMLVKMSEAATATGELFASLVARHFPPECVAVVNGGPDVAKAFCALPFDHLLFTGSTAVGRQVMRAAAENLTPVTLELGGKSPALVGRDFPVAEAAERILFGKCLNAGQTCIAPDYALVPEESVAAFIEGARRAVAKLYPRLAESPDYTSIVNDRQRERLDAVLAEATRGGATVVDLTPAFGTIASRKLAPRIVTGARDDSRLMQEEIFGPLLPVVPYKVLDDAIAYVNARPRPLALYVFDHDRRHVERVLGETVSGGVSVNETLMHIAQEDLPFGGVGQSGMGRYHGRDGFETFSVKKAVFHQSRVNGLKLFRPPYGARFEALVKFLSR